MRRLITVIVSIAAVVGAAVLAAWATGSRPGRGPARHRAARGPSRRATPRATATCGWSAAGDRCRAGENRLAWNQTQRALPVVRLVGRAGQPPYLDGFRAYNGSPFGDLAFFKDASGVVHLQGLACLASGSLCTRSTMVGGTRDVFRLPAAFRPTHSRVYTGLSVGLSDNYYNPRIDVTWDGYVRIIAPPSAGMDWISFDGISWLCESTT